MSSSRRTRLIQFWLIILLAIVGMTAALVASTAARASVIFHYDSACAPFPCPAIGLGIGDPVSGIVEFADGAIAPNAELSHADILGFALDFGTVDIDFASAFGFSFFGIVDATGNGFSEFQLIASDSADAAGTIIVLDVIGWAVGEGACFLPDCSEFFFAHHTLGDGATIARLDEVPDPDPLPIPVPPAALLVLAPLATLLRGARETARR